MNNLKKMEDFLKENMLPKQPCPKVKCAECGEEVCDNIYKKYRNRFVRKQISFAPPDQFYIMKSLHDHFLVSGKTDFITRRKVIDHVYQLHPTKILNLFNSYNNREQLYGNGNRISQEDKDKIVSCIYKDTTTTVNQVN